MNIFKDIFSTDVTLNGVAIVLLLISLIVLSTLDVRTKRVPNKYLIFLLAASLFFSAIAGVHQLLFFFSGLFVGGLLLLTPYLLGHIGGADLKIFAVIGSVIGYSAVIDACLYTFLFGMLLSVGVVIKDVLPAAKLMCVSKKESLSCQTGSARQSMRSEVAYYPAITLGTIAALLQPLEIVL